MDENLVVFAMSNFPSETLRLNFGAILSQPVNHSHGTGPGGSPAPTLQESPQDTLGPPDLTFWERVRKQGQRRGLRVT